MTRKLLLQLPSDSPRLVTIVSAIPDSWSWFDGVLYAPKSMLESGEAIETTGFALQRFHDPCYIGKREGEQRLKPNLMAMIVERKLPGFIAFDEAGFEGRPVPFKLVKEIAIAYLLQGYRGNLSVYRDHHNNNKFDNSADFSIETRGLAPAFVETNEGNPHISLDWDERFGGTPDHVQPILIACRAVGVCEFPALV